VWGTPNNRGGAKRMKKGAVIKAGIQAEGVGEKKRKLGPVIQARHNKGGSYT